MFNWRVWASVAFACSVSVAWVNLAQAKLELEAPVQQQAPLPPPAAQAKPVQKPALPASSAQRPAPPAVPNSAWPPAAKPSASEELAPPQGRELWSIPVRVGAAQSEATSLGIGGQIAVRGPLIVVAAGGDKANAPDDQDGIFIVDGRDGSVVRRLQVPGGDAAGVALAGDDVVVTAGSSVIRSRLDGLVRWSADVGDGRLGLPALADLNGDGVSDVVLPIEAQNNTTFLALDGSSGTKLWRVQHDPKGVDRRTELLNLPKRAWFAPYVRVERRENQAPQIRAGERASRMLIAASGGASYYEAAAAPAAERGRALPAWGLDLDPAAPRVGIRIDLEVIDGVFAFRAGALLEGQAQGDLDTAGLTANQPTCPIISPLRSANPLVAGTRENLGASCGLPPSLGNLDGDDTWDVVVADAEHLRAFSTGISADLSQAFPRGDLAATGMLPERLESLASYRSKLPSRDVDWWLAPDLPERARDTAFRLVSEPASLAPPAADEPLPPALAVLSARALSRDGERSAALVDGAPVVCWSPTNCAARAAPSDVKLSELALEPGAGRLWALSTGGSVFSLEPGTIGWVERSWPVPEGSLRGVERLRVLPGALAVLGPDHFWLLPRAGAAPGGYVHGAALRLDDVVQCGARWFGNDEGRLVAPVEGDLNRWAVVPGQPGTLRSLSCNGAELALTAADGTRFQLALPSTLVRWPIWGTLVALLGALLALAVWMVRSRPPRVDPKAVVSRGWRKDVPLRHMRQAAGSQQRLVQGLLDFIDNPGTRPPLSIAICGPWGSGKSSLMGVLHDELRETGRHVLVWFNAWRFQREEDITRAFYQTILDEFRRQASWPIRLKVLFSRIYRAGPWRSLWFVLSTLLALCGLGLFALVARGALLSDRAPLTASLSLVVTVLLTLIGAWNRGLGPLLKVVNVDTGKVLDQLKGRLRFAQNMKAEFETVFAGLGDALKLVVFVDDLDRCTPDRVTDMLEALNGIADTGHCVLVMGIDPAAVERAVHVRFKDIIGVMEQQGNLQEARTFGARYVEKMITASVLVPELEPAEVLERARAGAASEPVVKPWYRRDARAMGRALVERAPVAVTAAAIVTLLWSWSSAVELDLSGNALDRHARQLYDWCRQLATPVSESKPALAAAATPNAVPVAATGASAAESARAAVAGLPASFAAAKSKSASAALLQRPPEIAPAVVRLAPPPVEGHPPPHLELESLERRRFLLDSCAGCAFLLLCAGALGLFVQRRRAREARPMTEDSEPFREALARASLRLPALPRTVIRFENVSRFVFHIVQQSLRWQPGSERAFFDALLPLWLGQPVPPTTPEWLERELSGWLHGAARGAEASAASSGISPKHSAAE